ncbi:MAG TPA: EscU/YscU/HrcU family type III secretion system export apparatus switch protein [Opitutaceae bacterium]|nr:EscU/YscU/HrcU family type III secretion system export apparatus switch protein [Opitutaceae bacterium]
MAETDHDQKTEKPTEKRLNEAHERGQFAKSHELTVLFPIAAVLGVFTLTGQSVSREVSEYAIGMFSRFATTPVEQGTVVVQLSEVIFTLGRALGPLLLAIVGAVLLASGIQSGFRLTPEVAGIKFEHLDIVANFNRTFSKQVFVKCGIDLLKLGAIGTALWLGARGLMFDPLFSAPVEAGYLGQFLSHATILFLTRLLFALGIVAAVSYGYEKFKTSREMMMTREEVKDERKQAEGDAHVKHAMRRMARRLMQRQMLSAVKTADVVVTNPTHFAVALKYERGKDHAPVVLAKGENRFAQRIKALAAEHGVPTVENKPVARLLYAMGQVGETIPSELYQAVAEILAVVYRTHRYYFHRLKSRRIEASA